MGPDGSTRSTWDCTDTSAFSCRCGGLCRSGAALLSAAAGNWSESLRKRSRHTQTSIAQSPFSTLFSCGFADLLLTGSHHHPKPAQSPPL